MLTVKPAVTMIGGIETDQHGIYLGDELLCAVPCTEEWYQFASSAATAANKVNHRSIAGTKDFHYRNALEVACSSLAVKLNMNRYGMTNTPRETLSLELMHKKWRRNMETAS